MNNIVNYAIVVCDALSQLYVHIGMYYIQMFALYFTRMLCRRKRNENCYCNNGKCYTCRDTLSTQKTDIEKINEFSHSQCTSDPS